MSLNFSEIYNESHIVAKKLLCDHPDVKIVEMNSSSGTTARHIQIGSEDYGPIDEVANQILGKKEKTPADIAIARKLSALYGDFISENNLENQPTYVRMRNVQLMRFPGRLLEASNCRAEVVGFLNCYKHDPNETLTLLQGDAEIVEVTSWMGKVTRHIFIEGKDYGPIDGLSEQILAKPNKSLIDVRIAQKLSKLYRNLDEKLQYIEPTRVSETLKMQRRRFIKILQGIVYQDFTHQLSKNKKVELEHLYSQKAHRTIDDISQKSAQEGETSFCFMYTNENGESEEKILPVRKEYIDSVKRGFSHQAIEILDRTDLHPDIVKSGILEELRERKSAVEQIRLQMESYEGEEDMQIRLEEAEDLFYESLSKAFLMDLYFKLGDLKFLIFEILKFLEQTFTGHLATKLNECLPDPKYIPKYMNPERTITIHPNRVELKLVLDCSQQYKETGEEIGETELLPFGIRTTLKITLATNPGNTALLATAEKLDDAPTLRVFSRAYPLVVASKEISPPSSPITVSTEEITSSESRSGTPDSNLSIDSES